MTKRNARILQFVLRAGWFADVVVFDPARVRDLATYDEPLLRSEGIERVYVNGRLALTGDAPSCHQRDGRMLLRHVL